MKEAISQLTGEQIATVCEYYPGGKRAVAKHCDVSPYLVTRWIKDEVEPRARVFPYLLECYELVQYKLKKVKL